MRQKGEESPRADLREIVGARHELEQRTHRDRTLLRTIGLTHHAELKVDRGIDALTNCHSNQSDKNRRLVGYWGIQGVAKSVADLEMKRMRMIVQKECSPSNTCSS